MRLLLMLLMLLMLVAQPFHLRGASVDAPQPSVEAVKAATGQQAPKVDEYKMTTYQTVLVSIGAKLKIADCRLSIAGVEIGGLRIHGMRITECGETFWDSSICNLQSVNRQSAVCNLHCEDRQPCFATATAAGLSTSSPMR